MKYNFEIKVVLKVILVLFALEILRYGFHGVIAIGVLLLFWFFIFAAIWLISFLVSCILFGSIKEAWIEINPVTMVKELLS